VLDHIQSALNSEGVPVRRGEISGLLRVPTAVLALAAAGRIQALDAETARLSSRRLEILLYPFDLVISGERAQVSRAQAIAAERLPRTKAYLTWSEQGNILEDRLNRLWTRVAGDLHGGVLGRSEAAGSGEAMAELERIGREIRSASLMYEEWEVLFREALMVERDVLRRLMPRSPETRGVSKQGVRGGN